MSTVPIRQAETVALSEILGAYELGLVLISGITPETPDKPVQWVHSSDLKNPAPFLYPRTVLMTTGTQFPKSLKQADADAYVVRLQAAGVTALGFGIEIAHDRIPHTLVTACESASLPLFRVPYDTPFIAVSQSAARLLAEKSYAREIWSVETQRQIARSAISKRAMQGAVETLAERLGRRVTLYRNTGDIIYSAPDEPRATAESAWISREVRAVSKRIGATSLSRTHGSLSVQLQSVPGNGGSHGVLAVENSSPLDAQERSATELLVTLASFYLEQESTFTRAQAETRNTLGELFLSGQEDLARRVAEAAGINTPKTKFIVYSLGPVSKLTLEQKNTLFAASRPLREIIYFENNDEIFFLGPGRLAKEMLHVLERERIFCGISSPVSGDGIANARAEAKAAWNHLASGSNAARQFIARYSPGIASGIFNAVAQNQEVLAQANLLLDPLLKHDAKHGDDLTASLAAWLLAHGQTSRAAKEIGVHRHTLGTKIKTVGELLKRDMADPGIRAELFTALRITGHPGFTG